MKRLMLVLTLPLALARCGGGGDDGSEGAGDLGATCRGPENCKSRSCADGVCCDTACDQQCMACNVDGSQGTCTFALPASESCEGGVCDGGGSCVTGTLDWLVITGDAGEQVARTAAVSSGSGGVLVGGEFTSTVLSGAHQLVALSQNDVDGFVFELSASGDVVWSTGLGNQDEQRVRAVASAPMRVIVGAECKTNYSFRQGVPPNPTAFGSCSSTPDVLVAKLADDGGEAPEAPRLFGDGMATDSVNDLATRSDGWAGVVGNFEGLITAPGALAYSADGRDGYLLVLAPSLTTGWGAQIGGSGTEQAEAVAFDRVGDVLIAGQYRNGDFGLGGGVPDADATDDLFVAKLDGTSGELIWAKGFSNPTQLFVSDMDVGQEGEVIISLLLRGTLNADAVTLEGGDGSASLLAVSSDDGTPLWGKVWKGSASSGLAAVRFTNDGNIAVAGAFRGELTIAAEHSATGDEDAFVALLSSDGVPLWSRADGGAGQTVPWAIDTDDSGAIYVVGETDDALGAGFGGSNRTSSGGTDAWVARFTK